MHNFVVLMSASILLFSCRKEEQKEPDLKVISGVIISQTDTVQLSNHKCYFLLTPLYMTPIVLDSSVTDATGRFFLSGLMEYDDTNPCYTWDPMGGPCEGVGYVGSYSVAVDIGGMEHYSKQFKTEDYPALDTIKISIEI